MTEPSNSGENALSGSRPEHLREHIAAAVFDAERRSGFGRSQDDYFDVADAVLDALGLEQVGWISESGLFYNDWQHKKYDAVPVVPVFRPAANGSLTPADVFVARGSNDG